VVDHDLGFGMLELHQGRPQNVQAALARGIGKDVDIFLGGHGAVSSSFAVFVKSRKSRLCERSEAISQ
jgi:hypothetical protein